MGFDINEQYCKVTKERLTNSESMNTSTQIVLCDDARNIPSYLEDETVNLIFTSPPYANLLDRRRLNKSRRGDLRKNSQYLRVEQYSQDKRDLGTMQIQQYADELKGIYEPLFSLLKPRGHNVINVPDM